MCIVPQILMYLTLYWVPYNYYTIICTCTHYHTCTVTHTYCKHIHMRVDLDLLCHANVSSGSRTECFFIMCVISQQGLPVAVVSSASCEFPSMEGTVESLSPREQGGESSGDQDSGISLQIPSWKGPPMVN